MQPDVQSILSDLKAKREVRGPVLHFTDYWRTYGLMIVYGALILVFNIRLNSRVEGFIVYVAASVIIATAVKDSQRAINRRFECLVDLLEKKGVL